MTFMAKAEGCDVLLTEAVFDGLYLNGFMLAEKIRLVNPHVNIIFITDHADNYVTYRAWEIGAIAFLQRPYKKQRLAEALADPRIANI